MKHDHVLCEGVIVDSALCVQRSLGSNLTEVIDCSLLYRKKLYPVSDYIPIFSHRYTGREQVHGLLYAFFHVYALCSVPLQSLGFFTICHPPLPLFDCKTFKSRML